MDVYTGTTARLQVKGGTKASSKTAGDGDWFFNSTYQTLYILTSTPMSVRTVKGTAKGDEAVLSDTATRQCIEIVAGVKAQLVLEGVNISISDSTNRSPINMATNIKCTADGTTATKGSQIVDQTQLYLVLAPYSNNVLQHENLYCKSNPGYGRPAIRCGEGSTLVIDDAVRNLDASGNIVTPEMGVVPSSVTLIDGKRVEAGDPLSAMEPAGADVDGVPAKGLLECQGGAYSAAIGGALFEDSGTIIINGGNVKARAATSRSQLTNQNKPGVLNAGNGGAAIGGGYGGSGTRLVFNGGDVLASASFHGAAIGAGIGYYEGLSGLPTKPSDALNSYTAIINKAISSSNKTKVNWHHTVGGDIYINGGYVQAVAGGHGNAVGSSCSLQETSNTDHIIKVTGGTLITDTSLTLTKLTDGVKAATTYDIGGQGGHVLVTGGSVKVGGSAKFQGYDGKGGIAYNTHDVEVWGDIAEKHPDTAQLLPSSDEVFMVTARLDNNIDNITNEEVVQFQLTIDGEVYPYGLPARFVDGELYFWLPKWAVTGKDGKPGPYQVDIDMTIMREGKPVVIDTLYIPEPSLTNQDKNLVKRYRDFQIPDDYPIAKIYDGLPYNPLNISSSQPLVYEREDGGTEPLTNVSKAKFMYRMHDADGNSEGDWFSVAPTASGDTGLPTEVCTFDVEIVSTQYADNAEYRDSYWGHRAFGTGAIVKAPANIVELRAAWVDAEGKVLSGLHGDVLRERAHHLRVYADLTSGLFDESDEAYGKTVGEPSANTCKSPEGTLSFTLDGDVVASVELSEATATLNATEAASASGEKGLIASTSSWKKDSYDGTRKHTLITYDIPRSVVYGVLDADEADSAHYLSAAFTNGRNFRDTTYDGSPEVALTTDGLHEPTADQYTLTVVAEPAEAVAGGCGVLASGGTSGAQSSSTVGWGEQAVATVSPKEADGWLVKSIQVDGGETYLSATEGLYTAEQLAVLTSPSLSLPEGRDFVVKRPGAPTGSFSVTFPEMRRNHTVRAVFERAAFAAEASVRDGVGGTANVTAVNGEELEAPAATRKVEFGNTVTFSWKAQAGWRATDVLVNGKSLQGIKGFTLADEGTWTTAAVKAAVAFEVVYEKYTYPVTVKAVPAAGGTAQVSAVNGTDLVVPSANVIATHGDGVTVAYQPTVGYHVKALSVKSGAGAAVLWPVESYPESLTLPAVDGAREVTVTFEKNSYPVALSVSDEAAATISGPSSVLHGESAAVTWTAKEGYQITAVTVNGSEHDPAEFGNADGGKLTLENVAEAQSVHVTAELRTYQVSARVAAGNGSVAVTGPDGADAGTAVTVPHGASAAVTWAPAAGWEVERVTVGGRELSAEEASKGAYAFDRVTASAEVAVSFKRQTFRIDTYADRTLGSLTASAAVPFESDFPITWSPNGGVYIEDIVVDAGTADEAVLTDADFLASGTYTFAGVSAPHTFAVDFKKFDDPLVVVTAAGNGTASLAAGAGPLFKHGETAALSWEPHEGHKLTGATLTVVSARPGEEEKLVSGPTALTAEELAAGLSGGYRIENLQGGYRYQVAVSFEPEVYEVATSHEGEGSVTPTFEEVYGRDARVSFAPAEGWRVAAVTVDGAVLTADELSAAVARGHVEFPKISVAHSVAVKFERITYQAAIEASPAEGGTVALEGASATAATVNHGDPVAFAWQPNPGWRVKTVTVNGEERVGLTGQSRYAIEKLTGSAALKVSFERLSYPVTAELVGVDGAPATAEMGAITAPEDSVFWGENALVSWQVKAGWKVSAVMVDGAALEGDALAAALTSSSVAFPAVKEPHSVRVVLARSFVNVTGSAVPAEGGAVMAPGQVVVGQPAQVTWKANEGWHVAAVRVNGAVSAEALAAGVIALVAVEQDVAVEVTFERDAVPLTYTVSDPAGAELSGPASVLWGDDADITWKLQPGWHTERLVVNGIEQPLGALQDRLGLSAVKTATTVHLQVARDRFTVKTGISSGGTITPGDTVDYGENFTAAWSVGEGYAVASITVDDQLLAEAELKEAVERGSWTFSKVGAAHSLFVKLERLTCAIDAAAVPADGGTVRAPATVAWGDDASVTWVPRVGWHVDAVTVNGTPLAAAEVLAGSTTLAHVTEDATVRVLFERNAYGVAATVRDNVGGSAAVSDDAGAPAASVLHGDPFRFTWAADTGYTCADILVNGESVQGSGLFTLADAGSWRCASAEQAYAFEVVYEKKVYPVTVKAKPAEGGAAAVRLAGDAGASQSSVTVEHGGAVEVAYTPTEGWQLASIEVNGEAWPTASYPEGLTLTDVTEETEVLVTFEKKIYPLTLTVSDEAGAAITGPKAATHGEDAEVTWTVQPGYRVTGVTVDGEPLDADRFGEGDGAWRFPKVAGAHAVHVTVEKRTYPVTIVTAEGNGEVSGGGTFAHGESAAVSWQPARGWKVKAVTVDGLPLSAEAAALGAHSFTAVTAAHQVAVSFERETYLIETYADRALGTITSSTRVPFGDDFEVTWSPHATSFVAGAEVDGAVLDDAVVEAGRYLFEKVDAPHKVAVEFKPIPGKALVVLETSGGGEAHLVGVDDHAFEAGQTATVGWKAHEGSKIVSGTLTVTDADGATTTRSLTEAELTAGAADRFALANLQENFVYRVSVAFAPLEFTIATSSVGEGSVTATFTEQWGKDARVAFAPREGSRVKTVSVDGQALSGAALEEAVRAGRVEFSSLNADHAVRVEFEQIFCQASIATPTPAGGTVSLNGTAAADGTVSAAVPWGGSADFRWEVAEGWRVKAVKVDGESRPGLAAGSAWLPVERLTQDMKVEVTFERIPLKVTASLSDAAGGTVSTPGTVLWGDAATVSWNLAEGWHVSRVLVNGQERPDLLAVDGTIFAKVIADQAVRVEVARDEFEVVTTIEAPDGVDASITPTARVQFGDDRTVAWTLPEGWMAGRVVVDGRERPDLAGPGAPTNVVFAEVSANHAVEVTVEKAPETFALNVLKTGSVSDRDTLAVAEGQTVVVLWPTEEAAAVAQAVQELPLHRAGEPATSVFAEGDRTYVVTMPGGGHRLVSVTVDERADDIKEVGAYVFAEMAASRSITFQFEKPDEPAPVPPSTGDEPKPEEPGDDLTPENPGTDPAPDPLGPTDPAQPDTPAVADKKPAADKPAKQPAEKEGGAKKPVKNEPTTLVRLAQTGDVAAAATAPLALLTILAAAAAALARRRKRQG